MNQDELVPLIAEKVRQRLLEKGMTQKKQPFQTGGACSTSQRPTVATAQVTGARASNLAAFIDHTQLRPETSVEELKKLCKEARENHFFSVCVNTTNIDVCRAELLGSDVKICAVVGFPLGAMTSEAKAFETKLAIESGADEIDMVLNIGSLKAKDYKKVTEDIRSVVEAAGAKPVKVILETSLLNANEKVIACALSKVAGASFVKTSTGFSTGGATVDDVKLMRLVVGNELGVKASGGVRSTKDALTMIEAGANRLGTSASVAIVQGTAPTTTKGY